jgi:hypothetical protein
LANRIGLSSTESTPPAGRHWTRADAWTPPPLTRTRESSNCASVTVPSSSRWSIVVVALLLSRSRWNALSVVLTTKSPLVKLRVHDADGCSRSFSNDAATRTSLTCRV